jgi:hypothetical protein
LLPFQNKTGTLFPAEITLSQSPLLICPLFPPEIDLLDYVNILEQEEDKIPKKSSYPNLCLYKFPDRFNGQKELHLSGIVCGCSLISNDVNTLACGKNYHVTCHRYHTYKGKVNLKRKYEEGSDYMEGIATTIVK